MSDRQNVLCQICDKQFHNASSLNDHIRRVHSEAEKFKCQICEATFKRKDNLVRHQQTVHSEADAYESGNNPEKNTTGSLSCHICDKNISIRKTDWNFIWIEFIRWKPGNVTPVKRPTEPEKHLFVIGRKVTTTAARRRRTASSKIGSTSSLNKCRTQVDFNGNPSSNHRQSRGKNQNCNNPAKKGFIIMFSKKAQKVKILELDI